MKLDNRTCNCQLRAPLKKSTSTTVAEKMLYIRVCFIILLGTLSLLTSPVVSAPVGFISSTMALDQSTVSKDDEANNNKSIEVLSSRKTNEVLDTQLSEKTTDSKRRKICSLFKFSNFEKMLCFDINNDELKKFEVKD